MPTPPSRRGPAAQRMSIGHGLDWIVSGWAYFTRMLRPALLVTLGLLVATVLALALTSLRYGSVLFSVLLIFYLAIIARWCRAFDDGAPLIAGITLRQFLRHAALWRLAGTAGALTLALDLLSNTQMVYDQAASWSSLGLYFSLIKLLSLLACMAFWLAPGLVVLDGMPMLAAMKKSLLGALRNVLPWLLFSLLAFVFTLVAAIPAGLGLLAALPTLAAATYLAQRDLFR